MDLPKLKTGLGEDLVYGQIAIFLYIDLAFNLNQSNPISPHHLSQFYYQSLYSMTLHPTVQSSLVSSVPERKATRQWRDRIWDGR